MMDNIDNSKIEGDKPTDSAGPSCTFTFKKSFRKAQNTRQREPEKRSKSSSSDDSSDSDTKIVKLEKKPRRANPMVQKTGSGRNTRERQKSSSSEDDDDDPDATKRKDKSRISVFYESSKTGDRVGPSDMGATSIVETETEKDRDAQTLFEKSLAINKELKEKEADDGIYRGMNNYQRFIEKRDTAQGNAASGANRRGPIRAPDNVRVTVRWDYQPDICKDYKETGFCGFGDSCKFLHDRSDYKHGWQIEREMSEGRYGREDESAGKYEITEGDDELPFKCLICRDSFKYPVMTKCKHYFCEKCALAHYRKSARCFVCDAQTHGVFNPAKELMRRLKNEEEEELAHSSKKYKHSTKSGGAEGGGDKDDDNDDSD